MAAFGAGWRQESAGHAGMRSGGISSGGDLEHLVSDQQKALDEFVCFADDGLALIVFGLCYWLLDVRKARWIPTKPATIFGMNAIAAYVFSEVFALLLGVWCQRTGCRAISTVFARLGSPEFSSLVFSICFVLVCWALMWVLYRKRIFFKI